MESFIQFCIAILGLSSSFMSHVVRDENIRKYACVVGISGSPFWIYETYTKAQYGMLFLSCCYATIYILAIYRNLLNGKESGEKTAKQE